MRARSRACSSTGSTRRCSSPTPTSSGRIRERIAASEVPVRWVVIAAEPITDVDTTAAEVLDRLHSELAAAGITLAFAELKDPVKARLRRYGALANVTEDRIFPTVGTAVDAYIEASGETWTDWERAAARGGHARRAP